MGAEDVYYGYGYGLWHHTMLGFPALLGDAWGARLEPADLLLVKKCDCARYVRHDSLPAR